ncbi:MAG: ribonuclease P protein component [Candidatus Omnitrophica bacterium]|nr:ribonuclease P protein component [Candidatus Omnitrophota bacterium]
MKKFGFSRKERLKKSGEFVRVLRSGKKIRSRFLSLSFQEQPPASHPARLGIIVPKRVFKRAHDRNKMKRWIREAFRLEKPRVKPDVDLVAQITSVPEKTGFRVIQSELIALLEKADLIL